jgi:hypothetical protein
VVVETALTEPRPIPIPTLFPPSSPVIPIQSTTARRPSIRKPVTVTVSDDTLIANSVFSFTGTRDAFIAQSVADLIETGKMTDKDNPNKFKSEILDQTLENMSNELRKIDDQVANGVLPESEILNANVSTIIEVMETIEEEKKSTRRPAPSSSNTRTKPSPLTRTRSLSVSKPPPKPPPSSHLDTTTIEHNVTPKLNKSTDRKLTEVHRERDTQLPEPPQSVKDIRTEMNNEGIRRHNQLLLSYKPEFDKNEKRSKVLYTLQFNTPLAKWKDSKEAAEYKKLVDRNKMMEYTPYDLNKSIDELTIPLIDGKGLRRRVGRPKGSGILKPFKDRLDINLGIQPMANYISFGKYAINTKKLNDDIISIRHKTGGNILGHPSRKVSPNLAKVFRKIIGNGLPDFEDLSNLSSDERQYLYDVSKKSDIVGKLNIPAPSKDQQDKDNHNFEVMKGEILSGNDSVEMVKKFKVLILKMSKSGTLPKSQVNELLTDLAELGY